MSERFGLIKSVKALRDLYRAAGPAFSFEEKYNIPPGDKIPVLVAGAAGRELRPMQWGLIPPWTKDEKIAFKLVNARVETVTEKPAYREAVRQRRCILPASGFYGWKTKTLPFWFAPAEGVFSLCGVWESFKSPAGETIESCATLTMEANALVAGVHGRMPCILAEAAIPQWLSAETPIEEALALLKPWPAAQMSATPVSTYMNSPQNQGPRCIQSTR